MFSVFGTLDVYTIPRHRTPSTAILYTNPSPAYTKVPHGYLDLSTPSSKLFDPDPSEVNDSITNTRTEVFKVMVSYSIIH